jgi:signal transduction histidine kinase
VLAGSAVAIAVLLGGYGLNRAKRAREQVAQRRAFEAVLGERSRLAREIHDSLAQGLTSISLQLECARDEVGRQPARAAEHVELARGMVRDSLREARRSVWNLRPLALGEADLAGALRRIAAELTGQSTIACTHEIDGTPRPLPPDHEGALLRIGQEALTNAIRHAHPKRVAVQLRYTPECVTLCVRDDGRGFDVGAMATRAGSGFGLLGMRERAAVLAGSLAIDSKPGEGTEVSVTLPV